MTFSTYFSPGVSLQGGGASGGGGGGTPGGSSGQIQYNNGGSFGGMAGTSWDNTARALTLTGATLTSNAPVLNLSQTWNNAAVTFTGLQFNAAGSSDANSAGGSMFADFQMAGSSRIQLFKSGSITAFGAVTISPSAGAVLQLSTSSSYGYHLSRDYPITWGNNATLNGSIDLILTRRGAANLRLGAADAATALAQTLSVQSVVAGTTNGAGANFTITGSQGTGSGAGGSIIFQVAPAGGSGTAQNALINALTIDSNRNFTFGATSTSLWHTTGGSLYFGDSVSNIFRIHRVAQFYVMMDGDVTFGFTPSGSITTLPDTILRRDAANTLALRNGTNAQEFRVYETTTGTIYKAILGNRQLIKISGAAFDNGAGANAGTLTNSPVTGNPTKWIPIDDNGTTRYIPAW